MGRIKKILDRELVGGTTNEEIYPVSSTKAIYDSSNRNLDYILSLYLSRINELSARVGFYYCDTIASDPDKEIEVPDFQLSSKIRLLVKMNKANTANNVSFEVNNTGAKVLYYNELPASRNNTWEEGEVLDIFYDGTSYQAFRSKGNGIGDSFWELKTDEFGNSFIHTKYSIATSGGATVYGGEPAIPVSIFDNIPIDNDTIYWYIDKETGDRYLKSKGGGLGDLTLITTSSGIEPSDDTIFSAARTIKEITDRLGENGLWKLVEDSNGNKYLVTEYPVLTKSGITAYYEDILDPGGSGGIGGGTILDIEIKGEGNALINAYLNEDKSILNFDRGYLMDLTTEQTSTALKTFTEGIKVGDTLIKVIDGVLTLDCSLAVTGGITAYALGEQTASSIMDAIICDNTTITVVDGKLTVIGGTGGASNWDELEGKPSWITNTKPTYTWSEINNKPNTLYDYGIQASDVLNTIKSVDGSGSELDADTLDGIHANGLFTSLESDTTTNLSITIGKTTKSITDLCANSAAKLQTARTIWGQRFDGTANVTGSLTSVTDITGTGTFTGANIKATDSVYVNGIRLHKTADGVITLEGNLAVTGGITQFAVNEVSSSTIMDGVVVDGTSIKKENGVLKVMNAGGGEAGSVKWANINGKPTTLTGYGISASDVLSTLKTVDSNGSGLDADLLDGQHSSYFSSKYGVNNTRFKEYVTNDTHILQLGYMVCSNSFDSLTLQIQSAFWGNQHGSSDIISISQDTNDNSTGTVQYKASRLKISNTYQDRIFYAKADNTNKRLYLYVYVTGGNGYGRWVTQIISASSTNMWVSETKTNQSSSGLTTIQERFEVDTISNADKLDGVHLNGIFTAFTTNGNNTRLTIGGVTKDLVVPYSSNSDKLDGVQLNGLFTALSSSSGTNLSATIGGVTKTVADLYATQAVNADTVDNYHVTGTSGNVIKKRGYTEGNTDPNWYRIAKYSASSTERNSDVAFFLHSSFDSKYGILIIRVRGGEYVQSYFLVSSGIDTTKIRIYYDDAKKNIELYYYAGENYSIMIAELLYNTNRNGEISNDVIMYTRNTTSPSYSNYILPSFANIQSNSASATKLKTARTLWGRSFDGTSNINGNLDYVGNVNGSSNIAIIGNDCVYLKYGNDDTKSVVLESTSFKPFNAADGKLDLGKSSAKWKDLYLVGWAYLYDTIRVYASSSDTSHYFHLSTETNYVKMQSYGGIPLSINPDGNNVGIGTTSPSQKLHVSGNILATGGGTFYSSDIRAKTIIERPKLSLNSIANAPVIKFRWNGYNGLKDDNKQHVGGIAQYIEKILPECVIGQKDDFLSFDYATVGYVFSVQTARHLQSYETKTDREIKKLKNRITLLEKQLKKLGYEEVDIMAD